MLRQTKHSQNEKENDTTDEKMLRRIEWPLYSNAQLGYQVSLKKICKIHRYANNGYQIPVLAQYLIVYNFSKKRKSR